ncbi:MAG: ABC transporter permease [Anaerolineae bacterium]|nr:ABC transporter permease [Anaerolineae bacterium]
MSLSRLFLGKRGEEPPDNDFDPSLVQRSGWAHTLYVIRRDVLAMFSVLWIAAMLISAIAAPLLAPYPEQGAGRNNVDDRLLPPSTQYLLGTDELGRDVLSRLIYGARPAMSSSLVVVAVAVLIGTPLGAIAGYFGGWVDEIIMRFTDLFLAFPSLLLAMAIVALLGPSLMNAVIALVASWWPWYTRLVRSTTRSLREQYFVEAARSIGVSDAMIIWRHILPNTITPILVQSTIDIGTVILATTSLAFIGLGTQAPNADWGLMIEGARQFLRQAWWYSIFPGAAIFLTVLAFNLLGDTLRDIFDPRQYR